MKKISKNKFIIGLSTAVMGGILATGQVAYASDGTVFDEQLNTNNTIRETYVDPTLVGDNDSAGVEKEASKDEATLQSQDKVIEVEQGALAEEYDANQESTQTTAESTEGAEQNPNGDVLSNETEQTDTAANNDQASETPSEEEEVLLTEPSATTEDPTPVEEAEEPSTETTAEEDPATEADENLDIEIEAGAVPEDSADTANTEADTADEASTEKAQELEANTENLTNKETADANSSEQRDYANESADSPQETPAGDQPLKENPEAGNQPPKHPDMSGNTPKLRTFSALTVEEGAELTEAGSEVPAGDALLDGDSLPQNEGASEPPEADAGAESPSGDVNIAVKEGYTDPQADAAKIKNSRETNLTPGDTVVSGGIEYFKDPEDGKIKPKDGFKPTVIEPKNDSKDKSLYGYEIEIDKETGQRTYTWIAVSSSAIRTSPTNLENRPMMELPMMEVGDKLYDGGREVTYEATGPSELRNGAQLTYGYKASKEDLEHINNKDNDSTVLGMKDRYTKENVNGAKVLANANFEFNVNPWPDENDNLEPIRLQGNYDKDKKVYVHGQEIDTGLKVENLDANALDRLTAKVYNPENGEIVPGAEVYIDAEGNVKVKLPDGAVDTNGKINKKSIFYDDPKFNGAQSLDVKLYARPRTAQEFQDVADLSAFAPGTYTDTKAGTTKINHKGATVEIANQGIARYDHYNFIGEFEINLDDESNYDIITKDITANKLVTDKMLRLKAGVDKEIEQVDKPNSTAPHKYTTAKADDAVDSYLEPEYTDFLIPVEGEKNKYRTKDNWLVEVDPDNPQNMKVSTPIGAKKGENITLQVTHLFTNGSEKNFLINYVLSEESIEKPNYKSAVTEAGQKVTNTPTNEYTEIKPKPVKYELESTSIVDDNGKTWTLSIDEDTGVITATAPGKIDDKVSTINVPVIATYEDQKLTDINGNKLVYTERSSATFSATAPQEGEVKFSQDNTIEFETIIKYNPEKDPTESGVVQEGKNGKYTVDYTVTYKDGEVVKGPTMVEGSERDRVEPTNQIFEIGTKGTEANVIAPEEKTITIPHTTDVTYDDTKPLGYREETPGQDGEIKITYEIEQNDGQATVKATETPTIEAKPGKLVIGTKPIETESDTYTNQFTNDKVTINYVDDPDMNVGETREGEITGGEVKTVVESKYNPETGKIDTVEKTEVTPIVKTIYRGTKNFTGTFTHTEEQIIPFETEVVVDPNKKTEGPEITQTGKIGTQKRTITQSYVNGTMSEKNIGEYELVEGPTKQIITVGSLTEGTHSKEEEIPFETKVIYDSSIEAGTYEIEKTGVVGKKKTTWTIKNSEITDTKVETITEKQDALIKVGNKYFEGPVTHTETIELPYDIEIIESNEVPVGTRFVRHEGKKGSVDVTYTQNFKDGKPDGDLSRVESNKTNAQNMEVVVGTKAIESTVKPNIEVVKDDTLAAGTVEQGPITDGKVVTTVEKSIDPLSGKEVTREKTEVIPPTQTIRVGTKAYDGQVIYKEQKVTPFETEIVFDETLAHGETQTTQEGINKVEERTITQNLSNGTETTKVEGDFEVVEEGQKQIIKVGTKKDGTYTHTEELPYTYEIVEDSSLQKGEYEIDDSEATQGTVTTRFTIENSKVNEEKTTSETVKGNPVIIKVGTADFTGSVSHDVVEATPYDVKVVYDPNMKAGVYETVTEGKAGSKTTRYSFDIKNGDVVNQNPETTVIEDETVDPTTQVIKVGTKVEGNNSENTSNIPVNITITTSDKIAQGTAIKGDYKEGKVVDKVVSKYNPETGKIESTITPEVTPAELEILVGTQAYTGEFSYVERRSIPFETEIRFDDNLAAGETRVDQEGVNGVEERTITQSFTNGTLSAQNVPETFTNVSTGRNKVVSVGTMRNGEVVHKEAIPFEVEVKYDPSLKAGEYQYEKDANGNEKKGVAGEQSITYTIVNSKVIETSKANITKQPEKAVILVGNKDFEGTVSHEVTREVPFEVEIEYDDTLKAGEYKVTQQGVLGSETTKYEFNVKNGQAVDENPTTTIVESKSKDPVKQIVKVGRKPAENTNDFSSEIGIDVRFVADETKEQGSQPETTYIPGTVVNKVVSKYDPVSGQIVTTTEPEVTKGVIEIKYGTKDYTGEVKYIEKEYIDYSTKVTVDYSLKPNEVVVDTKGQVGIKERNVTQKVVNGKLTDTTRDDYKTTIQPVEQVIRIGANVTSEKPQDTTIEIPFDTRIVYDETKPLGYSNIDTEGQNGSVTITFSEEIKDGKVTVTASEDRKDPTTQVVTIGTKAIDNVSGTKEEDIKPEVKVVYDPNLEQGKVNTEVTDGKATASSDSSYNSETGEIDNNTDVKVDKPVITVTVGTKPIDVTKTEEIPFETEYVFDPTLDVGQQETQTEGQNGSRTITFERTSDGTTITEKEIEVKVTEPTKKVVRVGTKQTVTTEEIETPYETVIEYDNTKPVGVKEVTNGIPGKNTVTVTTAIDKDGNVVTSTKENIVSKSTNEKVIIGTKVTNGEGETTTKEVDVPFEVDVIEDETLPIGTVQKEQDGVVGKRTITVKTPVTNGVAGEPIVTDVVTKQPTKQIVRVGTKPVVDKENTVSKEVNTVINYVYDDTLEIGKTIEGDFTPGKVETKVVSEFDEKTGQIVTREETTVTPGTKTITIGTKPSETKTTVDIPFEIETILDDTIPAGQQKVEAGEKGEKEITITKTIVDGQPQINKVENVTKEAKNQVVRIGTKVEKLNDSTEKSITVDQPFDTEIIYDNSINAGDVVVEKEGVNGTRTIVAKTSVVDGVIQEPEVTSSITTEPTNKVIRIGTKAPDAKTEKIPFDTIVEHDPTLPAGTRLEVPGVEGEKTISYTTKVENGKITTTSEEKITKDPKAKKVIIGTLAADTEGTVVSTTEKVIPFETEIIFDNTLALGKSHEDQAGETGVLTETHTTKVVNGEVGDTVINSIRTKEPKNRIVRIGTKTEDKNTTVNTVVEETVPYDVIIEYDSNMEKGTSKVITEGVAGVNKVTYTTPLVNGVANGQPQRTKTEEITKKVDKVIKVGTKCPDAPKVDDKTVETKTTAPVQYETEIIYDDTISAGEVIEEQKGVMGERTVTSTVVITNGVAGQPQITSKITKEAVKQIIRIGTKKTATNQPAQPMVKTEEIPFETIIIYDNTIPVGTEILVMRGVAGEKRITLVDGKRSEIITKEPVNEIIRIGTKELVNPSPVEPSEESPNIPHVPEVEDNIDVVDEPTIDESDESDTPAIDDHAEEDSEVSIIPSEDEVLEEEEEVSKDPESTDTTDDTEVDESIEETVEETHEEETNDSDSDADRDGDESDINTEIDNDSDSDAIRERENNDEDDIDVIRTATSSSKVPSSNPKTGIAGSSKVLATLALAMGGFYAGKKKEDEEEDK